MTLVKSAPKKVLPKKPIFLGGTMNLFEELKRSKMEKTAQYFEKQFLINRS